MLRKIAVPVVTAAACLGIVGGVYAATFGQAQTGTEQVRFVEPAAEVVEPAPVVTVEPTVTATPTATVAPKPVAPKPAPAKVATVESAEAPAPAPAPRQETVVSEPAAEPQPEPTPEIAPDDPIRQTPPPVIQGNGNHIAGDVITPPNG